MNLSRRKVSKRYDSVLSFSIELEVDIRLFLFRRDTLISDKETNLRVSAQFFHTELSRLWHTDIAFLVYYNVHNIMLAATRWRAGAAAWSWRSNTRLIPQCLLPISSLHLNFDGMEDRRILRFYRVEFTMRFVCLELIFILLVFFFKRFPINLTKGRAL